MANPLKENELDIDNDSVKINSMPSDVGNAIFFQIVWFICVVTTDVMALIAVAVLLIIHSRFMIRDHREWLFILGFTSVGIVIDSLLQSLGIIQFTKAIIVNDTISVIPIWMMCLWVAFSTTLMHGLFWLHGRFRFAVFVGGFAVPGSYYGGLILSRSSAIEPIWFMLIVVGIVWAVLLPSVLFIAQKYGLTRLREISA